MASASSSSARHLFSDSKRRLADRVSVNVNNIGSVARQIVRSSKSTEKTIETYVPIFSLKVGKKYLIIEFRSVKSEYGQCLMVQNDS
ncbi:uncharacterized protein LOC119654536 isoform X2 [Hermetia illucens]|uniref:uncharacterized protein LOC119654536 isoform X2 n=1 Tax=Hermetia illucens TaxID=343691 RepID=UPI0018CC4552|nr:uncharacterized protein LOC119654536 isoform X2 [Hermetia illucens]